MPNLEIASPSNKELYTVSHHGLEGYLYRLLMYPYTCHISTILYSVNINMFTATHGNKSRSVLSIIPALDLAVSSRDAAASGRIMALTAS